MIIQNARIFCEDGKFRILNVKFDAKIQSVNGADEELTDGEVIDGSGMILLPGFIDIHIHGSDGVEADLANVQELHHMARFLAKHGTTTFCPTTMALPENKLIHFAEAVREFRDEDRDSHLAGIYLEGPFISPEKAGAHRKEYLQKPDDRLLKKIEAASGNRLKFVMVAPDIEGAEEFISEASKTATVCIGHTDCDYDEAVRAIDAGASQLTHLFNAMPEFMHRAPGPIGAAIDKEIYAELICDGIHVHPSLVHAAFCMFPEKIILITDALSCTGLPDGAYLSGEQRVILNDGKATLEDGRLAGSVLTMADAFRKAIDFGISPEAAAAAACVAPAKALGLYGIKGCIRPGADADLVLMDEGMNIQQVFLRGKEI